MLVVTQDTIRNAGVLETRSLPKKFFGRVALIPRQARPGLWARLLVEMQLLRYLAALIPFVFLAFSSSRMALPVTQAPLAMVLLIGFVEMKVLRLSDKGRARLMSEDEAARRLDTLAFRAKAVLRKIAAYRDVAEGELALVIEQSELARVTPLTLVSIQSARPQPHVLDLGPEERELIETELFGPDLTEKMVHHANLRDGQMIREVRIEARGISAHTRLAAWMEKRAMAQTETAEI
ncbi:hypothetical protein roselon_02271 [Roseibacterium elongatum DSM 19469]|uniref:Uncharacterized protein n=1 Tax=Roseicyclus elongatus DSM 19469 TaxID=1294273 RepID=W8S326_9RHOB|nr:hypothetical protein [Roseibacterium elongatum]AHM04607.1 hypothetical protein roselon_02271 [Roseibacterium elongatum DSM 19469]